MTAADALVVNQSITQTDSMISKLNTFSVASFKRYHMEKKGFIAMSGIFER